MNTVNRPRRFAMSVLLLSAFLAIVLADFYRLAGAQTAAQTKSQPTVLKGARLIDGTGRAPIENCVLVIEGSQIVAAGKSGAVSIPKDAAVQDVSGKTIMPAIVNLHGHLGLSNNGADFAARH